MLQKLKKKHHSNIFTIFLFLINYQCLPHDQITQQSESASLQSFVGEPLLLLSTHRTADAICYDDGRLASKQTEFDHLENDE